MTWRAVSTRPCSEELFCAFCNRGYDDEELMFFLYCRQTLLVRPGRYYLPRDRMPFNSLLLATLSTRTIAPSSIESNGSL